MKKNLLRVLSLALVACMLFAFTSCSQTIYVRFVDKNGNDVSIGGIASTGGTSTNPGTSTPGGNEITGETDLPAGTMPTATVDVVNFYKAAVDKIKNEGAAGYTKKEWQNVDSVNIGGSTVNNAVTGVLGNFMTVEADASEQVSEKGSDEAKDRFPAWTLTDIAYVASATCTDAGNGNYKVTIVMIDEDTPQKGKSFLGQVTNSLLYWEDIDNTLSTDSTVTAILSSYSGIHVVYKNYTITAEMTPDGQFVSLDHTADVDIIIGQATILKIFNIKDKSGHMWNYCKYYNFNY